MVFFLKWRQNDLFLIRMFYFTFVVELKKGLYLYNKDKKQNIL